MAVALAREWRLSPRAFNNFMDALDGIAVVMDGRDGEQEAALIIRLNNTAAAELLLAAEPFVSIAPSAATRDLLNSEQVMFAVGPDAFSQQPRPHVVFDKAFNILMFGQLPVLKRLNRVAAGEIPSMAELPSFLASQQSKGALLHGRVNTRAIGEQLDGELRRTFDDYLQPRAPVVFEWLADNELEGGRFQIRTILGGKGLPDARLYRPAANFALPSRLPDRTLAYQAYSSASGLSGAERADAVARFVAHVDKDRAAMLNNLVTSAGISFVDILDMLGDEGVIAAVPPIPPPPVLTPNKPVAAAEPLDGFALVALQKLRLRDDGSFQQILNVLEAKFSSYATKRDAGRLIVTVAEDAVLLVFKHSNVAFIGIGEPKNVFDSAAVAFTNRSKLGGVVAHNNTVNNLPASQLMLWLNTPAIRQHFEALGESDPSALRIMRRAAGPSDDANSAAVALRWKVAGDRWQLTVDVADISTVGVMAGAAIAVLDEHLKGSKVAEAEQTVSAITRAAAAAFERDRAGGRQLCSSATPVPAGDVPHGQKYQASTKAGEDFNTGDHDGGWRCLNFALTTPHYYRYHYNVGGNYLGPKHGGPNPGPNGFEVAAEGDLDGDGITSLISLSGHVDPKTGKVEVAPAWFSHNATE